MSVPTMDFDWLLDNATTIAFDPEQSSLYVFALGMTPEELQTQVLAPMHQAGIFNTTKTLYIDTDKRGNYRGQLPRVGLTVFDIGGQQWGIVLSYHEKFRPVLAQYTAWLNFWHECLLAAAQS